MIDSRQARSRGGSGRRWLLTAFACAVLPACTYDASEAGRLSETRRLVDPSVEAEVQRIKTAFRKTAPVYNGSEVSAPVKDAFNDEVDPANPAAPAYGGRVRLGDRSEPKRLTYFLDSSAITSEINRHIFNGLVYQDPETLKTEPDLATHWETQDVVWLKGHIADSIFERRSSVKSKPDEDNNYLIGKVVLDSIQWEDPEQTRVGQLTIEVDGAPRVVTADQMRVKVNEDGSYRRSFDRGVIFTFHLRRGVTFHDGEPFSADDVVFTLDTIFNTKIPESTPVRAAYTTLRNWEKLDAYTVRAYADEQGYAALDMFGDSFQILPKHVFWPKDAKFSEDEFAKHFRDHPAIDAPIGTGPYAFPSPAVLPKYNPGGEKKGWDPGNYVKLVRTGDFYDPYRRGYIDELYWYFYGDAESILRAMNNGECDFTRHFGSEEIFKKSNSEQFRKTYAKAYFFTPSYGFFALNTRRSYFQDKRVRQAFNMLLDRDRFNENISYGIALPLSGPQYIFGPAYDATVKPAQYNRRRAEELLNESGWVDTDGDGIRDKDGVPFDIELMLPSGKNSVGEGLGHPMKEDLEALGIRLNMRRLEWATMLEHIDDRKFDMYSMSFQVEIEQDQFGAFHSSQWADKGQNTTGYANPAADRLMLAIRRELDYDKRMKLNHELHKLLSEDSPMLFQFAYPQRGAYNKRLRNVTFSGKRPGYFAWQWYIPADRLTPAEREQAEKRWKGATVHTLTVAESGRRAAAQASSEPPAAPNGATENR